MDNKYIHDNFVIDIKNVSKDKNYITAFIHDKSGDNNYSFWISTAPYTLSYWGDVGAFIFRGNISAEQSLNFFNQKNCYSYLKEKLECGESTYFDSDICVKEYIDMFNTKYNDILPVKENLRNDENIDNIHNFLDDSSMKLDDNIGDIQDIEEEFDSVGATPDDVRELFDKGLDLCYDENDFSDLVHFCSDELCIDDPYGYLASCKNELTGRFIQCCDNLEWYSGKILDMVK